MPDPASRPAAPGTKPWLRVVLGLSLMLNLLIVGLVLGAVIRFGGPGERPPPPTGVAMFRALPSDDRRAMRDHLREALLPPSDRRSEAEDLAEVLSADPLTVDPETLDQLQVMETIKQGETIYSADAKAPGAA